MTPSKHLNDAQQKIFRDLVKQAKDLKTLHAIDRYQLESAAVLIEKIRLVTEEMETDDSPALPALLVKLSTNLNSTLSNLGLAKFRRSPKSGPVGAPKKIGPPAKKKDKEAWAEVLEFGKK